MEADNGRTALQAARTLKGALSIPILFMTGQYPNTLVGDLSKEDEQLLCKPFGPDSFLDTVARLLESRINAGRTSA